MGPGSARDLLRRAREQKKKQQRPDSNNTLENDPLVRVTAGGAVQCTVCEVDVRPADAMGWKAHRSSARHLQKQQQAVLQARKRDAETAADVSSSLQAQLTIAHEEPADAKRQKLETVSESSSSSGEPPEDASDTETGGLPVSFFDQGVEPADADSDDGGGGDTGNIPAGFFDSTAEVAPPAGADLEDSLAAFERDIAALPQAPAAEDPVGPEDTEEAAGSVAAQGDQWAVRTQRLVRLRAIIEDGRREMDPVEDTAAMDEVSSSESGSDCDYAEFESWRRGQL